MAKVNGTDDHGCPVECPAHSVCPCECGVHEVCCPNNNLDENGCKCADYCMEQEMGYDGRLCTVQCPCECAENEICCPGWRNSMGCLEANECISVPTKTRGDCIGEPCPAFCPAQCKHDEVKCPSQIDPCDGCPTEEVCQEIAKSLDGECCSVDPLSASHNCPVLCDEINGYVLCPAHMNPNGCKDPAECRERTKDDDGNYCPAHTVCPCKCNEDEVLCREGDDPRGCKGKCFCWPRGTDCDGELCEGCCPAVCAKGEVLVPGGKDEKGCELCQTCQPSSENWTPPVTTTGTSTEEKDLGLIERN